MCECRKNRAWARFATSLSALSMQIWLATCPPAPHSPGMPKNLSPCYTKSSTVASTNSGIHDLFLPFLNGKADARPGFLPLYKSQGKPELLLYTLGKAEELSGRLNGRLGSMIAKIARFRYNFGTIEKWELSGFSGVSDTNEAV